MGAELHQDAVAFRALARKWDALCDEVRGGIFLRHTWLDAWWRAFRGVDELWALAFYDNDALVAAWPLHLKAPQSAALGTAELRALGDLGYAQRSMLYPVGEERRIAEAWVDFLFSRRNWDFLDVPLIAPDMRKALEQALSARNFSASVERSEGRGRLVIEPDAAPRATGFSFKIADDPHFGLSELLRMLRTEWAAKDTAGPAADPQTVQFLGEIVGWLHKEQLGHIGLLSRDASGGAVAADLVVVDRGRHVQLLRGTDASAPGGATDAINAESAAHALSAGARRFELFDDESPLSERRIGVERLRIWNQTTRARLHRGVETLREVVQKSDTLDRLDALSRAAPERVQRAVAKVANYVTLHLYRGELFVKKQRMLPGLAIDFFTLDHFEALDGSERASLIERLDLQESYCVQKWRRGDTVVLARVDGRPSGIVWCARVPVFVPDIARQVRPSSNECYIHDVYVHPDDRGRQVAPAMLEFLAQKLRERDVYRAWALIERSNISSVRAFEKAGYASLADVIFAKMGLLSRLIVRPPDPEARMFLGL
jgi:ribosomal protein S18 acetylase RimI-like enzyme